MQVQHFLSKAGLDQHQIDVYLALITLGEATAGQIAKLSRVPRTYTYKILEELAVKDFVQSDSSRSIRRYSITDFEAPRRFLERQQLELYKMQQEAQQFQLQLENLAHPTVPTPSSEMLKDASGEADFWKLLHSTLTREVWVLNPPEWWGKADHSPQVKKWEEFRQKQHIWEKRVVGTGSPQPEQRFTDYLQLASAASSTQANLFLVDQYQVQVSCWKPFRALRIDHQETVQLMKSCFSPA